MRILIAEDDQVLADGLLRTLRASGAAVDHVADGAQADAALMTNTEFDLLILDLGLPRMHGLEVLKKLRSRGSKLPVLILTAADSVEERVKGLDYGADDYMAKPFSLQELEARVRALVRRGMGGATSTIKHGRWSTTRPVGWRPSTGGWWSCPRVNWVCWKSSCSAPAAWSARTSWSNACANGARRSATTRSRCTSTACARRLKKVRSVSPPFAAWVTAWKRFRADVMGLALVADTTARSAARATQCRRARDRRSAALSSPVADRP
jgi:CheY-like chemotaxis protein